MAYTIEHGTWEKRISVGPLSTTMVMGMYNQAVAAGEPNVRILDANGKELEPHQLALDLHSGIRD